MVAVKKKKTVDPYHSEYDGFYSMKWHDAETNALKRWFENYKVDKYASCAGETECMVVTEVPSTGKRGKRYHVDIIDEGRGTQRDYVMDHTAPEPPTVFFAAKRKYEPPPPKTARQLQQERDDEMRYRQGLRPMRYPVFGSITSAGPDADMAIRNLDYITKWVAQPPAWSPVAPVVKPPPPKHRRNV